MNNLKEIAFAATHYESAFGHFPPGTLPNPDLPPQKRLSWLFVLTPYVGQENVYRYMDRAAAWDAEKNVVRSAPIHTYSCPEVNTGDYSKTTYLGIAGFGPGAATFPVEDPRAGMLGYDRTTKKSDIADGLATTTLVIESPNAIPWAQGGPGTVRGFDSADRPYLGPGRTFGGHVAEKPWFGRNRLGANVAFADGSAKFLAESVSTEVLEALSTIAGKEELPAEW